MEALKPISIMDLTPAQLEVIETHPKVATPMTDWDHAPSQAYLMALILAEGNGVPVDQVAANYTMGELTSLVDYTQDQEDGPDPTPGSPS